MADFKKYEREKKLKLKVKSKRFFITGSSRSEKTDTVLTSSYNEMSKSFAGNSYLGPDGTNTSPMGGLIYMLNEMQGDINDIHSELSQSVYVAQVSEFSSISTGSFGNISSSLIPDKDNEYSLGLSGKEWKDLYVDGTAYVDAINLNGTTIARTAAELNAVTSKLPLAGGTMTGLIQPIVQPVSEAPKNNTLDVSKTNVVEVSSKQAITITTMTSMFAGQEVTIFNIGSGAITITHTAKSIRDTFFIYGGKNLTIATGQAYKFIIGNNRQWLVVQ